MVAQPHHYNEHEDEEDEADLLGEDAIRGYLREIGRFPLLSAQQEILLAHRGDIARLVECNLRLVVEMAKRYGGQGVELMELIAEGNAALLKAATKFDPRKINPATNQPYRFSTYATWWIKQPMRRMLIERRQSVHIPAYVVELIRKVKKLQAEHHGEVHIGLVAAELGISREKVMLLLQAAELPVSLDESLDEEEEDYSVGSVAACAEAARDLRHANEDESSEAPSMKAVKAQIARALAMLEPLARQVIELRYGVGQAERAHSHEEIGRVMGMSRGSVAKMEQGALKVMRVGM